MLDDRTVDVYGFEYVEEWSKEDNLGMKFKIKTIFADNIVSFEEVMKIA